MKRSSIHARTFASLLVVFCLLAAPMTALAKKGEKNYKRGLQYEAAQQWEKAAQEFTLAVAADPSNVEYQLHYRRAVFNASQQYMQQGRALAEQRDYIGAYNAFRLAYGLDPVNELSLSEMERMLRLQREKTGESAPGDSGTTNGKGAVPGSAQLGAGGTPAEPAAARNAQQENLPPTRSDQQLRVIKYNNDLKSLIRNLAEQLGLNVIFDTQSFRAPRTVEVNLTDVTTAQALDLIFLQEGLFFQKINRRTILVADQNRRAQYQQLGIRTFYLSNIDPTEARTIVAAALPPSQGRPQPNVIADKGTNSITVRDTSENLQLIAELLQSIDKDRAEVVMDVNIYEVSRTDLLQLGNQIGTGDSNGFFSLGSASGLNILAGARDVATRLSGAPTAFGAALVLPAAQLTAFQRKDRTKLVASTQVHAFSGEESSARIGQRVPVQTAQTFPFASTQQPTTPGGVTGGVNFGGGFPVIQYEPTGLTLKFTPQVFPNLDVQVKMSIESKDILNAGSLTPTFTERTITGTARIQNNRTMMLASVAQDTQSNGRRGLPLLGLIPILGRLFTSPTRNNTQIDIVIAVTPRVLRAPAVTPFDERERPSGTLSAPTTGSLEAMVRETEREEQLAAARKLPTNVVVQLPDTETVPAYVPAPKSLMNVGNSIEPAQPATQTAGTTAAPALMPVSAVTLPQTSNALANALAQLTGEAPPVPTALVNKAAATPTPAVTTTVSAAETAVSPGASQTVSTAPATDNSAKKQQGADSSIADKLKEGIFGKPPAPVAPPPPPVAELRLMAERQEMRAGEKQRVALVLVSKDALGATTARLRFDPKVLAVRGISQGAWPDGAATAPVIMQSIDPSGIITLVVSPQAGVPLKSGASVILFLDVEALAAGESIIAFGEQAQSVTADGRGVKLQLTESRLTVK
ncbi:MAG TPA: secretin N-terminal domain-containing protein [Pyrinomonadaceae bacterium]|nr:secretin N-terminal domain-containing protein [Pyrinomonadaceae bacterium]